MQNNLSQFAINLLLSKLHSVFDVKNDSQLAVELGVKQNTVSSWRSRGSADLFLIIAKCDNRQIDLNWLFDETDQNINFKTKCVQNTINQNDGVIDGIFDGKRNVYKTPSNDQTIFKTKCVQNAFNQNEGINEGFFGGKRNVHKTPSNNQTISETKCAENVTLSNGNKNGNKNGNIPNVYNLLPFDETKCAENVITKTDGIFSEVSELMDIPIVDISAAAGGGTSNSDYCETFGHVKLPDSMLKKRGQYLCINVDGSSMEPTLPNASKVVIRQLDRNDWRSIKDGEVYVITDREGGTYIKRCANRLHSEGALILRSDNTAFKPFTLEEGEIYNVWAVEWFMMSSLPDVRAEEASRIDFIEKDVYDIRQQVAKIMRVVDPGSDDGGRGV